MPAGLQAGCAQVTAVGTENHLGLGGLAFGVVTPPAAQRAAFQEDGGAYTGAIVDGIFFYVKYNTIQHG